MKECANCKAGSLPDELHFCPSCGADLDAQAERAQAAARSVDGEMLAAPQPGDETSGPQPVKSAPETADGAAPGESGATAASDAGTVARMDGPAAPQRLSAADKRAAKSEAKRVAAEEKKKVKARRAKKRRAYIRLGLTALGALLALGAVVLVLVRVAAKPQNGPIVYVRDGAVRAVEADGQNEVMLRAAELGEDGLPGAAFAADKPDRFVFVPQTADGALTGLAYADLKSENAGFLQLESTAVTDYGIRADGALVWYATASGELYLHDLSAKRALAQDAMDYLFSDDLRRCAYLTSSGELYYTETKAGAQPVKLSSGAVSLELLKGDVLAYTRAADAQTELVLYGLKTGKETAYPNARIAASFPDDDRFYFLRQDASAPLLNDPNAAEDARWVVEAGAKSEYGYPAGEWYYWYSFYESQGREEVRGDLSAMTRDEYLLYSARMALRQQLAVLDGASATLFFFNGKTAEQVETGVVEASAPDGARTADTPLLCVRTLRAAEPIELDALAEQLKGTVKAIEYAGTDGVPTTETTYLGDDPDGAAASLAQTVRTLANGQTELVTVKKTAVGETGVTGAELGGDLDGPFYTLLAALDGKSLYALRTTYGAFSADLFEKPAASGGAAKQLASGVTTAHSYRWGVLSCVPENGDPTTLTLYVGGETLDAGVEAASVVLSAAQGEVYYLKDYDGVGGALYRWKDGKATLLCENVARFSVLADGRALVLRDYSVKSGTGELCLADHKKGVSALAQNVAELLTPNDPAYYSAFLDD